MGYETVLSEMGAAAEAAADVAGQAAQLDPTADLDQVGSAMPESQSAGTARAVAEVWGQRWDLWSLNMRSYGESLVAARDGYQRNEEHAERDLHDAAAQQGHDR